MALYIIVRKYQHNAEIRAKGAEGEKAVAREIKRHHSGSLLNDIILLNNNSYCQIDHILVTNSAVYVIETKNYSGYILGSEEGTRWTVMYGKSKYGLYSPLKQNETHVNRIRKLIGNEVRVIPIVIFTDERCKFASKINGVYTLDEFKRQYNKIIKEYKVKIDKNKIYKTIKSNNVGNSSYHRFKQVQYAKKRHKR